MPGIDELLRTEGERWRTEVDAHRATTRVVPGRRRRLMLQWSGGLAGAAATAGLVVALVTAGHGSQDAGSASNASGNMSAYAGAASSADAGGVGDASATTSDPASSPAGCSTTLGPVPAGRVLEIAPLARCTTGKFPPAELRLTTADHRSVLLPATTSGVAGGVQLRIPATAVPGPATITDGQGYIVHLTVVAR